MKRLTLLLALFGMILFLAACGQGNTTENSNEETQQETKDETEQDTEENSGSGENTTLSNDPADYPQLHTEVAENEKLVTMKTSMGDIKIKLFPEQAPKTVENFITHSKNGYYEGVTFHRVINDFMIQGGDPQGTGAGGESIWGEPFEDEFSTELFNLRGALSMANAGPNTNGSQFFIVQKGPFTEEEAQSLKGQLQDAGFPEPIINAYMEQGGTPSLDFKHTVFGHVIEGMDIVDQIANVETGANDKPVEDVVIESITIDKE